MEKTKTKTDSEILLAVLQELDITASKLSRKIGMTPASLYHIRDGRNNFSKDLAYKIKQVYPQINFEFLTKGTGSVAHKRAAMIQAENNILFNQDPQPGTEEEFRLEDIPRLLFNINENLERIAEAIAKKE